MEKQKNISKWLKGLCILIAVMLLIFFSAIAKFSSLSSTCLSDKAILLSYFSWLIMILCYVVLYKFWNVCVQIGNDNSFSLENVKNFHHMSIVGIMGIIVYLVRILFCLILNGFSTWIPIIIWIAMIFVCFIFTVICEALSLLIKNAYEVKQENSLTI